MIEILVTAKFLWETSWLLVQKLYGEFYDCCQTFFGGKKNVKIVNL